MSTREKLKRDIDLIPEESLADASDYISSLIVVSVPPQKNESNLERANRIIQNYSKKISTEIDVDKERQGYFEEKYGNIY
jgi:hypothetical protein